MAVGGSSYSWYGEGAGGVAYMVSEGGRYLVVLGAGGGQGGSGGARRWGWRAVP